MIPRDIVAKKTSTHPSHLLTHFCRTIGQHVQISQLLDAAVQLIPPLIGAQGAAVLLLEKGESAFSVPAACFDDSALTLRFKTSRFPADSEMAGEAVHNGRPLIANEYQKNAHALHPDDGRACDFIRNRMDFPLQCKERIIGVISAINKKQGHFDQQDSDLLGAVAALTALKMDNIGFQEMLQQSNHRISDFNLAKDRVMDHISHTLKTPIAILIASLKLLERHLLLLPDRTWRNVYHRSQRNLERLLHIEYELEDILRRQEDSNRISAPLRPDPKAHPEKTVLPDSPCTMPSTEKDGGVSSQGRKNEST